MDETSGSPINNEYTQTNYVNIVKNMHSGEEPGPFFVFTEKKTHEQITVSDDNSNTFFDESTPLALRLNTKKTKTLLKTINIPLEPHIFGQFLFEKVKDYKPAVLSISSINKFKVLIQFNSAS